MVKGLKCAIGVPVALGVFYYGLWEATGKIGQALGGYLRKEWVWPEGSLAASLFDAYSCGAAASSTPTVVVAASALAGMLRA